MGVTRSYSLILNLYNTYTENQINRDCFIQLFIKGNRRLRN
ncbi:protein of unknown function [Candidatus Nitrosacidococcus tergens]|uniref:Uncharacterized protein n=1 Tax=Candidatus Nitrosacidococcus tergens TaxID=553981 RepID=A0A7G1Q7M5_9GAMM|nr:protein of unknown function [Candidatus Nitrosacidococcus tergens]